MYKSSISHRNGIGELLNRDIDTTISIFRAGQVYHNQLFPDIFCTPDDDDAIRAYFKNFLKPRNPLRTRRRFAQVWFLNDIPSGYVLFQHYRNSDIFFGQNRSFAHIEDIAVGEKFRQQGIASKLMAAVIAQVNAAGGGLVSGQVWVGNDASEKLFKSNGFVLSSQHFYRSTRG